MPEASPAPKLLEQLRAQSDAVRAQERDAARPIEEALQALDRRLWTAFRWLDEAGQHLEVIQPTVRHAFSIPGVLTIATPRYDRGFVSYRRRPIGGFDAIEHIELFYRMTGPKAMVVRVQPGAAAATEERLRAAHLSFRYETEQDVQRVVRQGVFTVAANIMSSVRFVPDYRRQRVEVTLRNVDRFESVILDFAAAALDEPALEDLVRFMLGESNQFLRRAPLARLGSRPAASDTARASQYAV